MSNRHGTTSRTVPLAAPGALGRAIRGTYDMSFPQLDGITAELLNPNPGHGYNPLVVKSLGSLMLFNAVPDIDEATGYFGYQTLAGPAIGPAIVTGRAKSAEDSKTYWGFSEVAFTNLDYFGATSAPGSLTIPNISLKPIVEDRDSGHFFFLPSPVIPNLIAPYRPDSQNSNSTIANSEYLSAVVLDEDGAVVLTDHDEDPATPPQPSPRDSIGQLTERAAALDANLRDEANPFNTSNYYTQRLLSIKSLGSSGGTTFNPAAGGN